MKGRWILFMSVLVGVLSCNKEVEDPLGQFTADVAAIDKYLSDNGIDANTDVRGIRFVVHSAGYGLPPRSDQTVLVKYTGKLLSTGLTFNQGTVQGALTSYIDGWRIGIPLLPKGAKATLYIPSDYGYGAAGSVALGVPSRANLIYEIELLNVLVSSTEADQLASDILKVDKYLSDNSITAVTDTTGLRYVITAVGTGAIATWYDKVKFSYSGRLLSSGVQFGTGIALPNQDFDSRVVDYIAGFQVGLQKLSVGSKATIYIPSSLAFGPAASDLVPANSNVVYEIELQELIP